ncbi:hypothetical protein ABZ543_13295 [Streptomyces roseifaciens]
MKNENDLIGKLRYFPENAEFPVCRFPAPRAILTEEEYAPYLAAADGKHDSYMRHGAPYAPGDLAYELVVDGVVVAWLPYDGIPRVIERDFVDARLNRARDLARVHLGADPVVQQRLANARADIDRMDADGFAFVIGEYRGRAKHGSKFNDFPLEISVREYGVREAARLRLERGLGTGKHVPVPNPTREYTLTEREAWSREAKRYDDAFQERFPQEYVAWSTQVHLKRRRQRSDLGSVVLKARDWVAFERDNASFEPAVVTHVREPRGWAREGTADLLTEKGIVQWVPLFPWVLVPARKLLPKSHEMWRSTWEELAKKAENDIAEYEARVKRARSCD